MTTDTEAVAVAQAPARPASDTSIRPFTVHVPKAKCQDLRRRIVDKGGHFPAWERPKLFVEELRAGLRSPHTDARPYRTGSRQVPFQPLYCGPRGRLNGGWRRASEIAIALARLSAISMTTLARSSVGRIVLHLLAMSGDRCVRFHVAGILRELPGVAGLPALVARACSRVLEAFVGYLVQPLKNAGPATGVDPQSLASMLKRGDVLLSDGNTRAAALVKCITRSPWSHVSLYVGPLDDGTDPRCIVEADIAAGVRSIRLSELNARQVRVLRPIGPDDTDRCRLADWVISRIGCEYDLAHAWALGRNLLLLPLSTRLRSMPGAVAQGTRRFICCSLLANAFALVGYPILPGAMRGRLCHATDRCNLTPADFEHAPVFGVVKPLDELI